MIKIIKEENFLILEYTPDKDDIEFVYEYLKNGDFILKKTFSFSEENIFSKSNFGNSISFKIGKLKHDYYKLDSEILSIHFKLFIYKELDIDKYFFIAKGSYNISIFKGLNEVISSPQDVYIGGNQKGNIPVEDFQKLLKQFPTLTELEKYKYSRIELILKEYIDSKKNFEEDYIKYMNKKVGKTGIDLEYIVKKYEVEKYTLILEKLQKMLKSESIYNEIDWQKEILQIIRLLYPKYISVLEEVKIKNTYDEKEKRLDLVLVNSNGNIDVVEIKRPFGEKGMLSKGLYRDNYVPKRELSGSIMQVEKYIFYLNKLTKKQEEELTIKYKDKLPKSVKINVINPQGLIIFGRDSDLDTQQKRDDFEIIKRKYKNIIDLITYDDLVLRVKNIVDSFKSSS